MKKKDIKCFRPRYFRGVLELVAKKAVKTTMTKVSVPVISEVF